MPRRKREKSGTGIYHVMMRGINRQNIFDDDEDFMFFIKVLHSMVDRRDEQGNLLPPLCTMYAYCLMSNHVHLLIREREENIGLVIKRIGVAYVKYFNTKYQRAGHLFQDRFLSEPVNSIEYFMTLMRYIHQNPVKAGITKEVRDYQWSSWGEYEANPQVTKICDRTPVINRVGRDNLCEYVNLAVQEGFILDIDHKQGRKKTDEEVKSMLAEISGLTYPSDIKKLEKKQRNHILKLACDNGANPRQIARITGISYGVIFNAKNDHREPSPMIISYGVIFNAKNDH